MTFSASGDYAKRLKIFCTPWVTQIEPDVWNKNRNGPIIRPIILNPSAAGSLREGLEETLAIHRLGLSSELGKSFSSTNCIESVMSQLGQYTDKVDRWRGGEHIQRWVAAGLLEIEPRIKKVRGFRYLKLLRVKLQEEVTKHQKNQPLGCATGDDLMAGIHSTTPEN